ncbi:MAG: polymerase III, subunit gamma and tau protein [Parcubacteria group bacterium GW2011_GWA2_47_8]|nr:MAG: polymerase III, subunit gamma and tau protein [Parcubacteria group bacterium GW2011_GWA2_47_8]
MALALYRKYRPQTFEELVGQDAVKKILTNSLKQGHIAHAYLFAGPRGVGKTSAARLFAYALNNGTPGDTAGAGLDIVEIDAASNRGIDDVKALRDEIRTGPAHLPWKVFILDEAHMFTKEAFNALLKSLEEPPAHTVFILATTEPHKIIPTIQSRCVRLDFHQLSIADMVARLEQLAKKEGVEVEEKGLKAIAINSKGGMRDAETLLGKVLSLGKSRITFDDVRETLRLIDDHLIIRLVELLSKAVAEDSSTDTSESMSTHSPESLAPALEYINGLTHKGVDMQQFLKSLVEYVRKLALVNTSESLTTIIADELTKEELGVMVKQSKAFTNTQLLVLLKVVMQALEDVDRYPLPHMALEVAVMGWER